MKTVAVHSGSFHADDVFAVAILQLIHGKMKIFRTRDSKIYQNVDFRLDVGCKSNPKTGDFDHHQDGGAGERKNGVPYASAGLIWKQFGHSLVNSPSGFGYIDSQIIQHIDAADNGYKSYDILNAAPYTISKIIKSFNPIWDEDEVDYNKNFTNAVDFAQKLLQREIKVANALSSARDEIRKSLKKSDGEIVILKKYLPYKSILSKESEVKYVIFPAADENWRVHGIPNNPEDFIVRKPFPKSWRALEAEELVKESGIKGAIFCHRGGFMCSAKDKKSAIELAKLSLQSS